MLSSLLTNQTKMTAEMLRFSWGKGTQIVDCKQMKIFYDIMNNKHKRPCYQQTVHTLLSSHTHIFLSADRFIWVRSLVYTNYDSKFTTVYTSFGDRQRSPFIKYGRTYVCSTVKRLTTSREMDGVPYNQEYTYYYIATICETVVWQRYVFG